MTTPTDQIEEVALPVGGRVISPEEAKQTAAIVASEQAQIQVLYDDVMRSGQDYGMGGGARKPFLHQPGAEKLAKALGISIGCELEPGHSIQNVRDDYFAFTAKAIATTATGRTVEKYGTCNSEESQYRRQAQRREWRDTNGERGYPAAEQAETLIQMAQKRAYVSAVLRASGASFLFTMDDDMESVRGSAGGGDGGAPGDKGHGICALHNVALHRSQRQIETDMPASHKDGEGWCNGKPAAGADRPPPAEGMVRVDADVAEARTHAMGLLDKLCPTEEMLKSWMETNYPGVLEGGSENVTIKMWQDIGTTAQEHLGGAEEMPW